MYTNNRLHLWEAYGVEVEYMIVDAQSLNVLPIADQILLTAEGDVASEIEHGLISWSNELALHVIELKTTDPAAELSPLPDLFQTQIGQINARLASHSARLMPTAMHPWMNPDAELQLWPHEYNPVYEAYHRIFDCRGHGWANLQSVHLNLPFADDLEFGRLHSAIRLLLPWLPALAASSPFMEGKLTGTADNRMNVYRHNSDRVPLVSGDIIPEPVMNQADYDSVIFQPMYQAIRHFAPHGELCHEWLNSRGAIARFERSAIEIRVLDVQECPAADIAICELIVALLKRLTSEQWSSLPAQASIPTSMLAELLWKTTAQAESAVVSEPSLLACWGIEPAGQLWTAGDVCRYLFEQVRDELVHTQPIQWILEHGTLARRIERAITTQARQPTEIYQTLCHCLQSGSQFI